MIMHSALTRLLLQVLQEQPGGLNALNEYLTERDEKPITNLANDAAERVRQLLQIWPEGRVGCDFAEHVLPIWASAFPTDNRVQTAIEAKRRWFAKQIDVAAVERAMVTAQQVVDTVEGEQPAAAAVAQAATFSAKIPCDPATVSKFAILAAGQAADDQAAGSAAEAEWQLRHLIEVLSE